MLGVPWIYLGASPSVFVSLQVYRNSVIAQWKAMNLDVLLTPMLGPALDLNASGRATGEACCASPEALIPSSRSEFSPVHCGPWKSVLLLTWDLTDWSATDVRVTWSAGRG